MASRVVMAPVGGAGHTRFEVFFRVAPMVRRPRVCTPPINSRLGPCSTEYSRLWPLACNGVLGANFRGPCLALRSQGSGLKSYRIGMWGTPRRSANRGANRGKGRTDADPARAAAIGLLHGRGHGHAIGAPRVGARSVPD